MTFVSISPITNKNGNNLKTGTQVVDPSLNGATLRVDCTTGNPATPFVGFSKPFNDPLMQISFQAEFSWDGGLTFPEQRGGFQNGSATGIWGIDPLTATPVMAPNVTLRIPNNTTLGGRPTHYRGTVDVINGPITFGLSEETF